MKDAARVVLLGVVVGSHWLLVGLAFAIAVPVVLIRKGVCK